MVEPAGGHPTRPPARRGAGRGGGFLFVAVVLFVVYLAFSVLAGLIRMLAVALLILGVVALLANVVGRR